MRRFLPLLLSYLCFAVCYQTTADARTIVVDQGGGGDYVTIQEALDAAAHWDEVVVMDGTYTGPLNTNLDFGGASVHLRADTPGGVTIDCEEAARGFLFDDGEDTLSVVEGLTIAGGLDYTGGAARVVDSSPKFRNCTFDSCYAYQKGGGVRVVRGQPVFDSCVFVKNHATGDGGAIAVEDGSASIRGCEFTTNSADESGGALLLVESSAVVISCVFTENRSYRYWEEETSFGGAVHVVGSEVTISDCSFVRNRAMHGAAVSLRRPTDVSISSCSFSENITGGYSSGSRGYGAAVHMFGCSPTISGCRFAWNEPTAGGTIWGEYSSPIIDHCTFFSNKGTHEPDVGHDIELYHTDVDNAVIRNCTFCGWQMDSERDEGALLRFGDCEPLIERTIIAFYNLGPGVRCVGTGAPTIRECIVFGNLGGDEICGNEPTNNVYADPLFCGFWDGDLTLCANSPALPWNNAWGVTIGAHDNGCVECDTPVERTSWGAIKAMYR